MLDRARERVAAAARRLAQAGMALGTAGNVSERDGDHIAITGAGAVLADVQPADVAVVDLDGAPVDGSVAPLRPLSSPCTSESAGASAPEPWSTLIRRWPPRWPAPWTSCRPSTTRWWRWAAGPSRPL